VSAEFFIELEGWFITAKGEQAVESVFDVIGIATTGTQDVIHDWSLRQHGLLIQSLELLCQASDGFKHVVVVAHFSTSQWPPF